MNIIEQYKHLRKTQVELHSKILDKYVSAEDFKKYTEVLGIVENKKIVLEANSEKDAILDLNIYGKLRDGKSALSEFMEHDIDCNELEEKVLEAMKKSDNLLYEVVEVNSEEKFVILKDVFNDNEPIKIIDIGLSASINQNVLVFTRLIKLDEINITSGLGFIFSKKHKEYLVRKSRKISKKYKSGDPSVDRFIAFFHLNRIDGIHTIMENVI